MSMKHKCSKCGHEDEVNPAKMLGSIRTPKKEAAWKRNGEKLKKLFANAKAITGAELSPVKWVNEDPRSEIDPGFERAFKRDNPDFSHVDTRVAPKGSLSKDDLKALIAGQRAPEQSLRDVPRAPFDIPGEDGDLRVTTQGKRLALFHVESMSFVRYLGEGELERLWAKRIIK